MEQREQQIKGIGTTINVAVYVTRSDKTSLIAVKYTYSFYGAYHLFCGCYSNSVSFIEFLRIFCIYDEVCIIIAC